MEQPVVKPTDQALKPQALNHLKPEDVGASIRAEAFASGRELSLIAAQSPHRPAVVVSGRTVSFAELDRHAEALAAFFHERGVSGGDVVAVLMTNRYEWIVGYQAALRSGFTLLPVNWHLSADDVQYILTDSGAVALITESSLMHLVGGDHAMRTMVIVDDDENRFSNRAGVVHSWDVALECESPSPRVSRGTQLIYTSGSTGRPKGVRHSPTPSSAALSIGDAMVAMFDMRGADGDAMLCPAPLYHSGPSRLCCEYPLGSGVTVVLMQRFDAREALQLIADHRITHAFFVPTMFGRMLMVPDRQEFDLSSLRFVVHGAGPCTVAVKSAMFEWLGPIIHEIYAATEGPGTWITPHEWLQHPGSVGRIDPHRIRIRDDDGAPTDVDGEGTVWFFSTTAFEYHQDPDKTKATYDESGEWYTVGDRGRIDRDGYLYLTGRTSECIISGGVNIYPARIDEALATAPHIIDGAAFGVPDADLGEVVAAAVVLSEGVAGPNGRQGIIESIIRHCVESVGAQMAPRKVFIVDELPRSDAGKLYRRRLVERFSE